MATFNSMPALSSSATPGPDALGLTVSDMDAFNACIAFDESMLDPIHSLPNLPFTPTPYDLETFSTTFEDPFSYPARPFGVGGDGGGGSGTLGHHHAESGYTLGGGDDDDASSPQELDNKLLGFGAPLPSGKATLVSEATGQFIEPHMTGELYGMFFVAEDVFGAESGTASRPLELTCYRRNLWQISGQVTLPRGVVVCYVDEQGRKGAVAELAASVTAVESIEGRVAEMITIPWRGSNAPIGTDETKVVTPPPVVSLDLASGQEVDGGSRVSVPVSWKRLQFKHATANNGRRKGLQQHYVVQINLLVKTKNGEHIKVAEIQSSPVIVRGRSPRNFDSRKEVPLGDKRPLERRGTDGSLGGVPSGSNAKQQLQQNQHLGQDGGDLGHALPRYNSMGNVQQSPADWATPRPHPSPNPQHPSKKMAISSPNLNRPPVPSWGSLDTSSNNNNQFSNNKPNNNPMASKNQRNTTTATTPQPLPINLSLSEDERSPNRSNSGDSNQSPQFAKPAMVLSTSGMGVGGQGPAAHGAAHNPLASPLETEDMLYEYFPLSLDDWMPPVDAIYRPHVVHHTIVPPEVKAQQIRSKAKRYFVAAE